MVDLNGNDYVDFGCSSAGAAEFMEKRFGAEGGVCVDADQRRIAAATRAGGRAEQVDVTDRANFAGKVRFAIVANILERQPDLASVARVVDVALHVSRSFVFIRSPWFNADDALLRHGLKFAWSNSSGATVRPTSLDLHRILLPYVEKEAINRFAIYGHRRIESADHDRVLPLAAERNAGRYDPARHPAKPQVEFRPPLFAEQVVIVARRKPEVVDSIAKRFFDLELIHDSAGARPTAAPAPAPVPARAPVPTGAAAPSRPLRPRPTILGNRR